MSLTLTQARDSIMATAVASLPVGFPVVFTDVSASPTVGNWARITAKNAGRHQKGFGDNVQKYVTFGVLCIEVFTVPGDGLTDADEIVGNAIRYLEKARSSPVWYRNIRPADIGKDGGFSKVNIYADYEFDDHH